MAESATRGKFKKIAQRRPSYDTHMRELDRRGSFEYNESTHELTEEGIVAS